MFYPDSFNLSTPTDREIQVTRDFNAPRQLVYDAFTKPELVRRWLLGPPGWTMPICEIDLIGTGTHGGDFDMGGYGVFKATGVKTTLRFRELLEIRSGQITYSSLTFDVHDLIRQLTPLITAHRPASDSASS